MTFRGKTWSNLIEWTTGRVRRMPCRIGIYASGLLLGGLRNLILGIVNYLNQRHHQAELINSHRGPVSGLVTLQGIQRLDEPF
jgi:hypothetical protein